MKLFIDKIKTFVRGVMFELAKILDQLTNGMIRPNHVTIISLLGHVILMLALIQGRFPEAAILLLGFGLLDSLDGAIAKYQHSESANGMLLDASTDRIKEALIYAGLAYYFAELTDPIGSLYTVLALGASFAVSYVKSKGEVAMLESPSKQTKKSINREFEFGIFGYEIRMFVLFIGFLAGEPFIAVLLVTAGASLTFIERYITILKSIR
jgi:CDP-diacylglycerol--glycerol-3-phosphate 3-phosphatidyltransferase